MAVHDDRRLFEMLCLEGAQAGLSWITILRKRETYAQAFDGFDAEKMARYDAAKRRRLLKDPGIVSNRLKVEAFIANAEAYLEIRASAESFDRVPLAIHRRQGAAPPAAVPGRHRAHDAAERCHEQGSEASAASVSSARPFATPSCRR